MSGVVVWSWIGVLLLGALHGINPGMGWLFAVALGFQEGEARAVWRALPPLAVGHALAIAAVVLAALFLGLVVPVGVLKWGVAAALLAMGVARLVRSRHPRWGGMRVGAWDLTVWSFLMASAHGAGLMVLPLVMGMSPGAAAGSGAHAAHGADALLGGMQQASVLAPGREPLLGLGVTLVHSAGYLLVTMLVAVLVYRVGLRRLRELWVNLDLVWAVVLIVTAVLTPLI